MSDKSYLLCSCQPEICVALPLEQIIEVANLEIISKLPKMPKWLLGITLNKQNIVPVIDISQYLFEQKQSAEYQLVLVVSKHQNSTLTILAKQIIATDYHITINNIENQSHPKYISVFDSVHKQIIIPDIDLISKDLSNFK